MSANKAPLHVPNSLLLEDGTKDAVSRSNMVLGRHDAQMQPR